MRLSFITPTKYIKKYGSQSDFILALSHLIDIDEENAYEEAIIKTNLPILCDNGLFENSVPESLETLVAKALKISATHFFAPDILFDSKGTQKELDKTIKYLENPAFRFNKIKIAAVVQANNAEDYMKQLLDFNNNPAVDLIGLSILSIPKSFYDELGRYDITESRILVLQKMKSMELHDGVKWKNCHLLGLGNDYGDVIYAKEFCPFVVSNDTSCCFQSGLFGKRLTDELEVPGGKVKEKVNFDLESLTREQRDCIQYNIHKCKEVIQK